MLDSQYHLFSVDTGHFYSNRETYLHNMQCKYLIERKDVNAKLAEIEEKLKQSGYSNDEIQDLKRRQAKTETIPAPSGDDVSELARQIQLAKHKRKKAKEAKEKLLSLLSNKAKQNEFTNGKDHVRVLKEDSLNDTNIISAFDSALSRAIGIKRDELTEALIIAQVYYFDVFKDISFYGFLYKGEKYSYFTSSAGQIRKKKAVFMKESVWRQIEKNIMCGLTVERINAKGGNNVNKHLAYMALTNTATDEWGEFDIDRCIVVDDFETNVYGTFDFVDETDYSITRKTDYVPVPHTDGAGMMLPSVSAKNFMFRAPWIKGLLGVFDFRKFVRVNDCSPVIRDIYGTEHNIMEEDIQIIFTKSQFKMHRYYDSWEEYKSYFKSFHCGAGRCNVEEERVKNAKLNYQMLQTLTDITDEEIDLLTRKSADRIQNICRSKETMMDILGITPYNETMTPFQKSVKRYPALLGDSYAKDVIRDVKNSLLKKYRSGKLEVNGKYTFLLPDFYAACEYWFMHIENPDGLLEDGEVFCWLFRRHDKVDCLRSPHLYREHAVRQNAAGAEPTERAAKLREWFVTNGLYASSHDLISKLLMYDVDGDQSLVVADPAFVAIAERNMNGIAPLYYNMRKAKPEKLSKANIYAGLSAAFTGGNIGIYSNNIAKIWNDEVFWSGTAQERQDAIDCVKRLCCQNNFVIDFAKTLYKPEFPPAVKKQISKYASGKLPAFFEFAKDKDASMLKKRGKSLVDQIYERIPDKPINTRGMQLGEIDYQKMMRDKTRTCSKEAADLYDKLNRQYRYRINMKDGQDDNLRYLARAIREEFQSLGYSDEETADMLVCYLYGRKKRYKQLLWFCYGEFIAKNLEQNIKIPKQKAIQCADCGEWIEVPAASRAKRCRDCAAAYQREQTRLRVQKHRKKSL